MKQHIRILLLIALITSMGVKANPLLDFKIGDNCTNILENYEKNNIQQDATNPEMFMVTSEFYSLSHTIALECKDNLLISALAFTKFNNQDLAIDHYKSLYQEISLKSGKPSVDNEDLTDARIANAVTKGWIDDENKYTSQWEAKNQTIMISSHEMNGHWVVTYSLDSPSNNVVIIR